MQEVLTGKAWHMVKVKLPSLLVVVVIGLLQALPQVP